MGIDVYMVVDGKWIMEDENGECHWEGARGYLRNPLYGFRGQNRKHPNPGDDDLVEINFIDETPKVLTELLGWTWGSRINKYLNEPKSSIIDTNMDVARTFESLDKVKSALLKLEFEFDPDDRNYSYLIDDMIRSKELIDFMRFGIELQIAGKNPTVLEF